MTPYPEGGDVMLEDGEQHEPSQQTPGVLVSCIQPIPHLHVVGGTALEVLDQVT